jgi:serine/threonine-protein phosphatase 2B catalytic subunit
MSTQIQRAIDKIQVKDPIPSIDFTQHVLEDGTVISTQERVVKDVSVDLFIRFVALLNFNQVQAPAMLKPTTEQFFNKHGQDRSKPDIAFLKNHFYREGRVTEDQALWILEKGTDILRKESNVLQVDAPITGP